MYCISGHVSLCLWGENYDSTVRRFLCNIDHCEAMQELTHTNDRLTQTSMTIPICSRPSDRQRTFALFVVCVKSLWRQKGHFHFVWRDYDAKKGFHFRLLQLTVRLLELVYKKNKKKKSEMICLLLYVMSSVTCTLVFLLRLNTAVPLSVLVWETQLCRSSQHSCTGHIRGTHEETSDCWNATVWKLHYTAVKSLRSC